MIRGFRLEPLPASGDAEEPSDMRGRSFSEGKTARRPVTLVTFAKDKKKVKIRGESILNFVLVLSGIGIMAVALQMGFGNFRRPGSGLFPFFCGLVIFLANLVLLVKKSERSPSHFSRRELKGFFWMAAPFFLWVLLMPLLGYILMTFLSTLFLSKALRLEGWRKPLVLSMATTGLTYFLFGYYLYLDLPRGFLNF